MILFCFRFPAVDWSRLLFTSSFLYHLGTFQVCAGMVRLMMRVWLFPPHKSTYLPHISRVKLDFSDILRLFQISSSSSRHRNIAKKLKRCDSKDNTMMVSIMRTCRVLYSALFQWHGWWSWNQLFIPDKITAYTPHNFWYNYGGNGTAGNSFLRMSQEVPDAFCLLFSPPKHLTW